MNKYWIGALALALLGTGCIPRKTETVDGSKVCFSTSCIREADNEIAAVRAQRRQEAKAAKERQKQKDEAAKREETIKNNPWVTSSIEEVKQIAKKNGIGLVLINRDKHGLLSVQGMDLASLKTGVNTYGQPLVIGNMVMQPVRNKDLYPDGINYGMEFKALCINNILIDPMGGKTDMNNLFMVTNSGQYQEKYVTAIWKILCSHGTATPEPELSGYLGKLPGDNPPTPAPSQPPKEATL